MHFVHVMQVKKRVESDKKMFGGQEVRVTSLCRGQSWLCSDSHCGPQVMGKTLAVAGLGNIGAKVAKAGLDLGMKVCGHTLPCAHNSTKGHTGIVMTAQVIGYDPGMSLEYAWSLPGGTHPSHSPSRASVLALLLRPGGTRLLHRYLRSHGASRKPRGPVQEGGGCGWRGLSCDVACIRQEQRLARRTTSRCTCRT